MRNLLLQVLVLAQFHLAVVIFGFKQEITFYTSPDANNHSRFISFCKATPNLSEFCDVIKNSTSFCVRGYWMAFDGVNYTGQHTDYSDFARAEPFCLNNTVIQFKSSLRHPAASESTVPAISLYEGKMWGGQEVYLSGIAEANIPFSIASYGATGNWSNWTFYSGPNFDGTCICIQGSPYSDIIIGYEGMDYFGTFYSVACGCGEEAAQNVQLSKSGTVSHIVEFNRQKLLCLILIPLLTFMFHNKQ